MILEKDNAARCAAMAKIRLTDAEKETYQKELQELFVWVKQLSAVDVSGVEECAAKRAAYLRPDEPVTDETLSDALVGAFNDKDGSCAKVKKVL